ncbi:MAG: hypothetical protein IPL96_12335 [Holophagaceae bacterium]|nr:hypothetical protein [Holophagaceae bacterium]
MNTYQTEDHDEESKTCPKCGHQTEHWALICEKCEYEWAPGRSLITRGPSQVFGFLGWLFAGMVLLAFAVEYLLALILGFHGTCFVMLVVPFGFAILSLGCFIMHSVLNRKS